MQSYNRDAPSFEINHLSIIAIRKIGRCHISLVTLCCFMNLPPPMNIKADNDKQNKIASVYQEVANTSIQNASNDWWFKRYDEYMLKLMVILMNIK